MRSPSVTTHRKTLHGARSVAIFMHKQANRSYMHSDERMRLKRNSKSAKCQKETGSPRQLSTRPKRTSGETVDEENRNESRHFERENKEKKNIPTMRFHVSGHQQKKTRQGRWRCVFSPHQRPVQSTARSFISFPYISSWPEKVIPASETRVFTLNNRPLVSGAPN